MQPRLSPKRDAAMTLFEVGVVVAVLMILAVLILPALRAPERKAARINCVNNLKQLGLAYRIWGGDNGDKYPMGISVTNGGSMEMVVTGNVVQTIQVMSNELGSIRIPFCPMDRARTNASSFAALTNTNISYFVGVDVTNDLNPQMILAGDGNFSIGGVSVKSGLLAISANSPVAWTSARHGLSGNLGFADGSVQEVSQATLTNAFGRTGVAPNRLAIP